MKAKEYNHKGHEGCTKLHKEPNLTSVRFNKLANTIYYKHMLLILMTLPNKVIRYMHRNSDFLLRSSRKIRFCSQYKPYFQKSNLSSLGFILVYQPYYLINIWISSK